MSLYDIFKSLRSTEGIMSACFHRIKGSVSHLPPEKKNYGLASLGKIAAILYKKRDVCPTTPFF